MMRNVRFENRERWPTQRPSFKIILFEWKWILIGFRGFIDQFMQNNFALKSRNGVATSWARNYRPVDVTFTSWRPERQKSQYDVQRGHSSVSLKLTLFSFKPVTGCILIQLHQGNQVTFRLAGNLSRLNVLLSFWISQYLFITLHSFPSN